MRERMETEHREPVEILPANIGEMVSIEAAPLLKRAASRIDIVRPKTPFWQGMMDNLRGAAGWIEAQKATLSSNTLRSVATAFLVATMVEACAEPPEAPYVAPTRPVATKIVATPMPWDAPAVTPTERASRATAESPFTEMSKAGQAGEILQDIMTEYGIEIPNRVSRQYSEDLFATNAEGQREIYEIKPNALLTPDEAGIISETLGLIPSPGYLVQIIIPFRNAEEGAIPGGSSPGWWWPALLHMADYSEFPNDRFLTDKAAIELKLPEGVEMLDPLPALTEKNSNVVLTPFLQMAMNSAGLEANTTTEIPWTTYGERLKQAVVHETGHSLLDKVSLENSGSVKEFWERQGMTLYNMNTLDVENPLLKGFAQVNGWEMVAYPEVVRQYNPQAADELEKSNREAVRLLVWDRSEAVWGDLANRKVRLTPYASYGPIQEAFCEYWMVSILYPELLTPEEREFFQKIQDGLEKDPEVFIRSVVSTPDLLVQNAP